MQICFTHLFVGAHRATMTRPRLLPRLLCLVVSFGDLLAVDALEYIDPMPSMVAGNGYPLEIHSTMTTDGYILGMHRIPYGVKSPPAPNKPVVFLMHHMYGTSYSFTYLGKDHSLAFLLADAGYDVWLGNTRGNVYARSNIYVSTESPAFWDFSWHERGAFDLPAMIDYVLEETNQEKLSYVSLSRGGTMFFVLMSILPEYNDKIKVAVNMAPYVFRTQPHNVLEEVISQGSRLIEWITVFVGINEFHMTHTMTAMLDVDRCRKGDLGILCDQMFFLSGGFDSKRINKTKVEDMAKGSTLGVSMKELAHFAHLTTSKRFSMYDYSFVGNVARYGSLLPPSYDLRKVTAPVVIINSKDDITVSPVEIDILLNELPNVVNHILIEEPGFTHVDFVAADEAKTIVYGKILEELEIYLDT